MIFSTIVALIPSLLQDVVLFWVGKMLQQPIHLRKFLGLQTAEEDIKGFAEIIEIVAKIGQFVTLLAIVRFISTLVSSFSILSNL
ncbi:MAG: hypothetical protein AAF206_00685 [Bacteroidota bacterium]